MKGKHFRVLFFFFLFLFLFFFCNLGVTGVTGCLGRRYLPPRSTEKRCFLRAASGPKCNSGEYIFTLATAAALGESSIPSRWVTAASPGCCCSQDPPKHKGLSRVFSPRSCKERTAEQRETALFLAAWDTQTSGWWGADNYIISHTRMCYLNLSGLLLISSAVLAVPTLSACNQNNTFSWNLLHEVIDYLTSISSCTVPPWVVCAARCCCGGDIGSSRLFVSWRTKGWGD